MTAGARPRRVPLSGVASLTASELRVARSAAAGRSNREIAQALFVTVRTIEGHLTHAYQKLGIASRGQLAEVLDEQPAPGVVTAGPERPGRSAQPSDGSPT